MIAQLGQQPITYAYKDMDINEFAKLQQNSHNFQLSGSIRSLERDLTMIASFGLVDKLKEGVHSVIEELYNSGVNTRIITGDHKDTALFIAREMGIMEK
jgi:Ca2+-transporting ATPase